MTNAPTNAPSTAAQSFAAFQKATELHRAGRVAEAEAEYIRLLPLMGEDASLLNWLGVLRLQTGRRAEGLELISRSVAKSPTPGSLNDLGEALRQNGRSAEAAPHYRRALELAPHYHVARVSLAMVLAEAGQLEEALVAARQAAAATPDDIRARAAVPEVLERSGKLEEAITEWESLVRKEPHRFELQTRLGTARGRNDDFIGAAQALQRAVELAPNQPEAHWNLAMALSKTTRADEAVRAAQKAVELAPNRPDIINALGLVLDRVGRVEEAEGAFRRCLSFRADVAPVIGNLASCVDRQGRVAEALELFQQAHKLAPESAEIEIALASLYTRSKLYDQGAAAADRAVALAPNSADAHGARAISSLAAGDWETGFLEYEWRWRCKNFDTPRRAFPQPMWDASDPAGRTILVHSEQGFGDILQFARYLPLLAAGGAIVLLECKAQMIPLLKNVAGVTRAASEGLILPRFDLHVPMLSLPAMFRTTRDNIPGAVPYLVADAPRIAAWREKLDEIVPRSPTVVRRIGLCWGGSPKPDPRRTVGLAALAPLAQLPNVVFVSLQKDEHAADAKSPPPGMRLVDLTSQIKDFADSAALIASLDAVITVDSAVAHLAGGLAARTFTFIPFTCDWRWLPELPATAWYPTMRLFRQKTREAWLKRDWTDPVADLFAELKTWIASPA